MGKSPLGDSPKMLGNIQVLGLLFWECPHHRALCTLDTYIPSLLNTTLLYLFKATSHQSVVYSNY